MTSKLIGRALTYLGELYKDFGRITFNDERSFWFCEDLNGLLNRSLRGSGNKGGNRCGNISYLRNLDGVGSLSELKNRGTVMMIIDDMNINALTKILVRDKIIFNIVDVNVVMEPHKKMRICEPEENESVFHFYSWDGTLSLFDHQLICDASDMDKPIFEKFIKSDIFGKAVTIRNANELTRMFYRCPDDIDFIVDKSSVDSLTKWTETTDGMKIDQFLESVTEIIDSTVVPITYDSKEKHIDDQIFDKTVQLIVRDSIIPSLDIADVNVKKLRDLYLSQAVSGGYQEAQRIKFIDDVMEIVEKFNIADSRKIKSEMMKNMRYFGRRGKLEDWESEYIARYFPTSLPEERMKKFHNEFKKQVENIIKTHVIKFDNKQFANDSKRQTLSKEILSNNITMAFDESINLYQDSLIISSSSSNLIRELYSDYMISINLQRLLRDSFISRLSSAIKDFELPIEFLKTKIAGIQ